MAFENKIFVQFQKVDHAEISLFVVNIRPQKLKSALHRIFGVIPGFFVIAEKLNMRTEADLLRHVEHCGNIAFVLDCDSGQAVDLVVCQVLPGLSAEADILISRSTEKE